MLTTNLPTSSRTSGNCPSPECDFRFHAGFILTVLKLQIFAEPPAAEAYLRKRDNYAPFDKNGVIGCDHVRHTGGVFCANQRRHSGADCSARTAGVRTTSMSRRGLYMDARLLGVRRRCVLLGAPHLGACSARRRSLDDSL